MGVERSEIEPLIGKESGPIKALDDVSTSNVRRWYEIMDEPDMEWIEKMRNAVEKPFPYIAEAKERILAEQKRVRERPVPLPMMMTWARAPYWTPEPKEPTEPHELALKALEDAGYALTIGINLEEELVNPVNIGDWLSFQVKLEGISSGEEETKLGKGYLVDLLYTFSNQQGEVVSKHKYTVLKIKRLTPVS
jgi:hypothetical protein